MPQKTDTTILVEELDEYQTLAMATSKQDITMAQTVDMCALGLGEAGEVQNLVKKWLYHGHTLDIRKVLDELGDVLWYTAVMADALGFDLSYVASQNIEKLKKRYPQGFSNASSINRQG